MRVSVVNFCSSRLDMLDFSSSMLQKYAGTDDYDYIVVAWNPTEQVLAWLDANPHIIRVVYDTDPNLDYIPNLRAMFNTGFNAGLKLSDYVCIVNTDMAFGTDWLANLVRRAEEDVIPNSFHLTPIKGSNVVTVNLGIPTRHTFDVGLFWELHRKYFSNVVQTDVERGGWEATNTLPYIIHRKYWEKCGPWELEVGGHNLSPDRRFFGRCAATGARFVMCHDSICYHHEAVERRTVRPHGTENMTEGR